jgi:outer membrane lipoprotein-sorting protein
MQELIMSIARVATVAAVLSCVAGSAIAQSDPSMATPIPPRRPPAADAAQTPTPPAIKPPPAIGGLEVAAVKPPSVDASSMPADQRATLEKVNSYLNAIRVMSGSFTQVGPDGSRSEGKFWVSKPGKLRFEYSPPSPVELVADGRSLAVRNRKLNTQDLYLIKQTPLRFLLADHIDLVQDADVTSVAEQPDWITVTLVEKSAIGGSSRIQLMFSSADNRLKQWTVTDAQGYDTTVALFDVDTSSKPPDRLFSIDEHRTL